MRFRFSCLLRGWTRVRSTGVRCYERAFEWRESWNSRRKVKCPGSHKQSAATVRGKSKNPAQDFFTSQRVLHVNNREIYGLLCPSVFSDIKWGDAIQNKVNEKDLQLRKQPGRNDGTSEAAGLPGKTTCRHPKLHTKHSACRDSARETRQPTLLRKAAHFLITSARCYMLSLRRASYHLEHMKMLCRRTVECRPSIPGTTSSRWSCSAWLMASTLLWLPRGGLLK